MLAVTAVCLANGSNAAAEVTVCAAQFAPANAEHDLSVNNTLSEFPHCSQYGEYNTISDPTEIV